MNKIVLALDLDGCLYDWHSAVHTYYQYIKGFEGSYEEFWTTYINSLSKETQEYICSLDILYETQVVTQEVREFLDFASTKAELYYVTSRPITTERVTRRYLKKQDFPFQDNLYITSDKATICRYIGATHFLDDNVGHIKNVSPIADAYLMSKVWNRDYHDQFNTVYGLKDFRERVFG